jgi:hypothetical protein
MKLIILSIAILALNAKYTKNFGCDDYREALFQYGNAFTAYSANNSAKYYSQAPAGKSLGNCNVVPCVGSPVFLIEKAHQYIDQQFDLQNKYSSVQFLGFKRDPSKANVNHICYKLVFSLSHFGGKKYIGVELDAPIQGLGNASYKKMILNSDLDLVKKILGETKWDLSSEKINCGDQKLFYSFFNRGNTNNLGYSYAGQNQNTVSPFLLSQIAKANSASSGKVCSNAHYNRVFSRGKGDYYRDETQETDGPLRENFYCQAKGLSVDRIRIGCNLRGQLTVDNLESFQLIKRDHQGNLTKGPI